MVSRTISDTEVARLLQRDEGRLFIEAVERQLILERDRDRAVAGIGQQYDLIEARLRRAVIGRVSRVGRTRADQTQAFRRTRQYREMEARVAEVLRVASRQLRDGVNERLPGAGRQRIRGLTTTEHFAHWASITQRRIRAGVTQAILDGNSPVLELDKALLRARQQAATLTRTAATFSFARRNERQARRDGFELVRYVAILDGRTSDICLDLAGKVFEIDKGPRPPQHFNCRSFVMPAISRARVYGCITPRQFEQVTGILLPNAA